MDGNKSEERRHAHIRHISVSYHGTLCPQSMSLFTIRCGHWACWMTMGGKHEERTQTIHLVPGTW